MTPSLHPELRDKVSLGFLCCCSRLCVARLLTTGVPLVLMDPVLGQTSPYVHNLPRDFIPGIPALIDPADALQPYLQNEPQSKHLIILTCFADLPQDFYTVTKALEKAAAAFDGLAPSAQRPPPQIDLWWGFDGKQRVFETIQTSILKLNPAATQLAYNEPFIAPLELAPGRQGERCGGTHSCCFGESQGC